MTWPGKTEARLELVKVRKESRDHCSAPVQRSGEEVYSFDKFKCALLSVDKGRFSMVRQGGNLVMKDLEF